MTWNQQRFAWITVGRLWITVGLLWIAILFILAGMAIAEEKPAKAASGKMPAPPISYDLPREQVEAYGRLEAEGRALRAETTLALKDIEDKRGEILAKWKALVGGDLKGWQLDLAKGQLKKEGIK